MRQPNNMTEETKEYLPEGFKVIFEPYTKDGIEGTKGSWTFTHNGKVYGAWMFSSKPLVDKLDIKEHTDVLKQNAKETYKVLISKS